MKWILELREIGASKLFASVHSTISSSQLFRFAHFTMRQRSLYRCFGAKWCQRGKLPTNCVLRQKMYANEWCTVQRHCLLEQQMYSSIANSYMYVVVAHKASQAQNARFRFGHIKVHLQSAPSHIHTIAIPVIVRFDELHFLWLYLNDTNLPWFHRKYSPVFVSLCR